MVRQAGFLDRASLDVGVEELPPRLDFGQLGHVWSLTGYAVKICLPPSEVIAV